MAMDSNAWGTAVANAIQGLGVVAGTPISPSQLETMWQTIKSEDQGHLTDNMDVASDGATQTGPSGGPLPITGLPGTVS